MDYQPRIFEAADEILDAVECEGESAWVYVLLDEEEPSAADEPLPSGVFTMREYRQAMALLIRMGVLVATP